MSPTPIDTAPADTARAMHAAEMRGQDMQDAPERIWATEDRANFCEDRFHATSPMKGLTEYTSADLCITDAECQRRIDAAVQAEREVLVDLADDIIRASNTLMLMLVGDLTMTKPAVESALRHTLDARNTWDTAIRARGQK